MTFQSYLARFVWFELQTCFHRGGLTGGGLYKPTPLVLRIVPTKARRWLSLAVCSSLPWADSVLVQHYGIDFWNMACPNVRSRCPCLDTVFTFRCHQKLVLWGGYWLHEHSLSFDNLLDSDVCPPMRFSPMHSVPWTGFQTRAGQHPTLCISLCWTHDLWIFPSGMPRSFGTTSYQIKH